MGRPIHWIIAFLILLNLAVVFFPDKEDQTYIAIEDAYRTGNGQALLRYMLNQSLLFRDRLRAAINLGQLIKSEEKYRPKYEILLAKLRDDASNENEREIFLEALSLANLTQDRKKLDSLWNTVGPLVDSHRGSKKIKKAQKNGTIPALTPGTEVDLIVYASWGHKKNSNTFRSRFGSSSLRYKGLTSEEIESRFRDARTVGIIVRSKFVVGDYAGYDATRHAAVLYLVDLEDNKILKAERVLGSMPPESIKIPVYQAGEKPKWKPKKTSGELPDVEGYFIDRHAGTANPGS